MFEFPSLFNSAAYFERRAIDILNIVLFVHVGCVAVAFPRNKPSKISCLSSNKVRLHDLMKHSKSKIMCWDNLGYDAAK